jgi:succinate dehydrogenase / fumarate reductase flavoprotein subunit
MITEIEEDRGFVGTGGMKHLHLDLTHLGADKINQRLPLIREVCIEFVGLDPIEEPIPVRPVAHYSMGGIETDINGLTRVPGLWVAGEAACVSLHGANRLGSNSTAECLAWGGITGGEAAKYLEGGAGLTEVSESRVKEEENRVFGEMMGRNGPENPYEIKRELRELMDAKVSVFRTGADLEEMVSKVKELKARFDKIRVQDKRRSYNSNLVHVLEIENLLELAEVMVGGAVERKESRGAHARRDFPTRDDDNWLKHTLAFKTPDGPKLDYKKVNITTWKPVERKY